MRFYTRQRRMPTVIIVSLIDIFAILLIFVIVTTTFKQVQPEVAIKLPESSTAGPSEQAEAPLMLTVSSEGKVFLEQKELALEALRREMEEVALVSPKRRIAMRADENAPFGSIIRVLDVLKEAGVSGRVSALTEGTK